MRTPPTADGPYRAEVKPDDRRQQSRSCRTAAHRSGRRSASALASLLLARALVGGHTRRLALPGDRDASGRGVVLRAMASRHRFVGELVGRVLVGALEVVADCFLRGRGQRVHHLADPRLPAPNRLALRHTRCRLNLRRHALDLLHTAVVVTGVDHGLFFGHRRFVLLLGHADGADAAAVEELTDDGLVAGQQHLTRAEHDQVLAEQHAHVVRYGARDIDVVGNDQDRAVDLRVDVDQQLGQVSGTHRVQTRVGLVAKDDLRVEHQRTGQAGALAHTAGDLTGELGLIPTQADQLELLHDDVADLAFLLLGVLTQGESGVVVDVHRAEQRTVLEHDAEQRADLVKLLGRALDDVGAVDDDLAPLRAQQTDQGLEEDGFTGTGRAEEDADLTGRDLQSDVFPNSLGPEGFCQALNLNSDAHARSFRQVLSPPHASRLWLESL